MLFKFFQKTEKQNTVREHFGGFQDQFTANQKKAIMCSLFLVANSDGEYHKKEHQVFEQTATILGYKLHFALDDTIDELMTIGREQLFTILSSLDEGQKDWYIITVLGMVHADGVALDKEFEYAMAFFDRMEITVERCENVMKKSQLLMEMFS